MYTLFQLEQLVRIAETGTISAASELLHLSQPALSRSMQHLEAELDVCLFERKKNRLTFTETGMVAVALAKKVLEDSQNLIIQTQEFERKKRTVYVCSTATGPLWTLPARLSAYCSGITINTELCSEEKNDEELIQDLIDDKYQLILLTHPVNQPGLLNKEYCKEHLLAALAKKAVPEHFQKGLSLHDLDGKTFLLLANIGGWKRTVKKLLPHSDFIVLDDIDAFSQLADVSVLPAFTSDIAAQYIGPLPHRQTLPLLDPEMNPTYYCICKKSAPEGLLNFMKNG